MNIIFLDFDGVIRIPLPNSNSVRDAEFDFEKIKQLVDFCKETNSQLVISSDWRHLGDQERIENLIGKDIASLLHPDWKTPGMMYRYEEVDTWLKKHSITNFAVLEDSKHHFPPQSTPYNITKRIAWCEWETGLTLAVFKELKYILNQ
jgi:hypothetical protein